MASGMASLPAIMAAGGAIVKLMSSFTELRDFEKTTIEESFAKFGHSTAFAKLHRKAIRAGIKHYRYDDIQYLLEKDSKGDLLKSDSDIIQAAIVQDRSWLLRHESEGEKRWQLVQSLIAHGAPVQTLDSYGNSAIYYACVCGHPKTFSILLDKGANPKTLHKSQFDSDEAKPPENIRMPAEVTLHKLPGEGDRDVSRPGLSVRSFDRGNTRPELPLPKRLGKIDLLQVALDALIGSEYGRMGWQIDHPVLQDNWGPIVMTLLEAGLELKRGDPGAVRFFQVACYSGRLDYVRKLLEHNVDLDAGQEWGPYMELLFASPLHAAVMGGRGDTVRFLIDRGYRLTDRRPFRGISGNQYVTPIELAFIKYGPWQNEHDRGHRRKVLELCQALVAENDDIAEADAYTVIRECVKDGHLDLLQKLKDIDMIDLQVPDCDNLDIVRLLIECGAEVDPKHGQNLAIRKGSRDMLDYLVGRYGFCVKLDSTFGSSVRGLIEENHTAFLENLLSSYVKVNDTFGYYDRDDDHLGLNTMLSTSTLLNLACRLLNVEMVATLLRRGADPLEPEPSRTAFHVLHKVTKLVPHQSVNSAHIQVFQLLRAYAEKDEMLRRQAERNLTAEPDELADYVSRIDEAFGESPGRFRVPSTVRPSRIVWPKDDVDMDDYDDEDFDHEDYDGGDYDDDIEPIDMADASDDDEYGSDASVDYEDIVEPQKTLPHRSRISGSRDGPYPYTSLTSSYAIRVLNVEPAADLDAPIRCSLKQVDLSGNPEYEALSYVWGDPSQSAHIVVDGVNIPVTLNLWSALCRARLKDKPRTIWADAVCINQTDIAERNQQVRIMKDVYHSAARVLIWFGENADRSELIFEHMNRWRKWRDAYLHGAAPAKYDRRGAEKPHWLPPMFAGRTREAFRVFCGRPWFFRTWTIQERMLAKEQIIMCGPYAEEWSSINTAAEYSPKTYVRVNSKAEKAGFLFCKRDFELGGMDVVRRSSVWSGEPYTPLTGVNAAAHFARYTKLSTGNAFIDGTLAHSLLCRATDPKDKVYGLLALFDSEMARVDYALPVAEVYRSFIQSVIEDRKDLKVLHWFGPQRTATLGLPSWVPDMSAASPCGILPRKVLDRSRDMADDKPSPGSPLPGLSFRANDLLVRGYHIATITSVAPLLPSDPAPAPDTPAFRTVFSAWESLAASLVPRQQQDAPRRAPTDMFLETLLAWDSAVSSTQASYSCEWTDDDYTHLRFSRNAPFFMEWYARHGTGRLREADETYFHEYDVLRSWWTTRPAAKEQQDMADGFWSDAALRVYGRCLYVTDKGDLGLAPPGARVGDRVVYLPGADYPFVMRLNVHGDGAASMLGDCYLYRFDPWRACEGGYGAEVEYVFR